MKRDKTVNPAVPPKLMFPSTLHCTYYATRLDNGYGSRRLLLAFAFDRPHKSIHRKTECRILTVADSLKIKNLRLLFLITGFLCSFVGLILAH